MNRLSCCCLAHECRASCDRFVDVAVTRRRTTRNDIINPFEVHGIGMGARRTTNEHRLLDSPEYTVTLFVQSLYKIELTN